MCMRLFFAIPVDDETRAVLSQTQSDMKRQLRHSRVSWVAPENFHITLHFLGDLSEEKRGHIHESRRGCVPLETRVETLRQRFQELAFPAPFDIRLCGADAFPSKKDPKTLLVHAQMHPSLFGVYKRLADLLVSLGHDIDERSFRPHVTLGRVRVRAEALKPECLDTATSFTAARVVLYKSHLSPEGSHYEEWVSVAL